MTDIDVEKVREAVTAYTDSLAEMTEAMSKAKVVIERTVIAKQIAEAHPDLIRVINNRGKVAYRCGRCHAWRSEPNVRDFVSIECVEGK